MLYTQFRRIDWCLREGMDCGSAVRDSIPAHGSVRELHQGIRPIDGVPTKHHLREELLVLLRGHGNAVVGASVRMAVYRAVYTEANAKLLLQAKMLGGPINYLAPEEAAIMESSQMTQRPGHGTDRIWELLKSEAIARTGRPKR